MTSAHPLFSRSPRRAFAVASLAALMLSVSGCSGSNDSDSGTSAEKIYTGDVQSSAAELILDAVDRPDADVMVTSSAAMLSKTWDQRIEALKNATMVPDTCPAAVDLFSVNRPSSDADTYSVASEQDVVEYGAVVSKQPYDLKRLRDVVSACPDFTISAGTETKRYERTLLVDKAEEDSVRYKQIETYKPSENEDATIKFVLLDYQIVRGVVAETTVGYVDPKQDERARELLDELASAQKTKISQSA